MPITYEGDLSTNLDKVRFYLGDTVDGTGVKPDGTNFTDAELSGLIDAEGSWKLAIAAAADTLALMYAPAVDITVGPRSEKLSQAAAKFETLAKTWRRRAYGDARQQIAPTRVDGFSTNVDAEEV